MRHEYAERALGKSARQSAILEILAEAEVATQNDFVKALKKKGLSATQVSISRDIAELGLVKAGGIYKAGSAETGAHDPELPLRTFVRQALPAGPYLTVVRCETGTAPRVALALDNLGFPGAVGTLAGDDTVFVAMASPAAQKRLVEFLLSRMNPE